VGIGVGKIFEIIGESCPRRAGFPPHGIGGQVRYSSKNYECDLVFEQNS